MRYRFTESATGDLGRLSKKDKKPFFDAFTDFLEAADRNRTDHQPFPAKYRVKKVEGASTGVREMTWSFSGPDGRATWEWSKATEVQNEGAPEEKTLEHKAVLVRRVGDHKVFKQP